LSIVPILKDGETLSKILEQGLEEEYQSEKEFIIKLFMSIKDKIRKEDLTIYEPIFASNVQKRACAICEGMPIFIVLTAGMFGCVLTIGKTIR
jgi:hypothetical protein